MHGGGFYNMRKYMVAPPELPEELTWFKWESYATWISGFFLLVWVYYLHADLYTIDPAVRGARALAGGGHRHRRPRSSAGSSMTGSAARRSDGTTPRSASPSSLSSSSRPSSSRIFSTAAPPSCIPAR